MNDTIDTLPLVSVIIPTYNHGAYLDAAIDSVLRQDYPHVELIVLDDGSTDDTPQRLGQYAGRFYIERHANMGQAGTINKGWALARGEILSYLGADDCLLPHAVSLSVSQLRAHEDAVMTYGDFNLIDPASKMIRRVSTPEFSYFELVVRLVCAPGPGVFLRRDAVERAGGWDTRLQQIPDFEYWMRLGLQGRFLRIPEVLANYRTHERSPSFGPVDYARAEEPIRVVGEYYRRQDPPAQIRAGRKRALSNAHVLSARLHLRAGRFARAVVLLWRALRLYPGNCFDVRTWRLILNGLTNQSVHRVVWALNRLR